MDRHQLALDCQAVEKSGGSVREYLSGLGFISPWGTWFNLQREELNRKDFQITDGRGERNMARKVTMEQKKKAVEIAIGGGNPLPYLRECGSDAPDKLWYWIKQKLKEADPETYAKLPKRVGTQDTMMEYEAGETFTVTAAPEPVPEVVMTIDSGELLKEEPVGMSATKPVNYDGFQVTAIRSESLGEFYYDRKYRSMDWRTNDGDEVSITTEVWHVLADELPKILGILGI